MSELTINDVKEFFCNLPYDPCIEFVSENWVELSAEVMWLDENKDVYSAEMKDGVCESHGHKFINCDDGCGWTITYVFASDKQLTIDEWDESYE